VFYQSKISEFKMPPVKNTGKQSGFTLIEIMVVVVIIGILASVVVPRIMDNPDKARTAKAKNDIQALGGALDIYRLDNYVYPTTDQGLEALINKPTSSPEPPNWKQGGYIKKLSKDPWGNEYLYLNPGEHGETDIYSLGADGAPGGDGANKDIGSWDQD
jgi:general secretion pathway protein G